MSNFRIRAKSFKTPEQMAEAYLMELFPDNKIEYPINPFKLLRDEGILFSLRPFDKLEGVYLPGAVPTDMPVVGINVHRPITRQRYTAAHELCHHFRDYNKENICSIGELSSSEKFAEGFAAALLMPLWELRAQVNSRKVNGYIDLDAVLEIADYFGVSFLSCLYRIAYNTGGIPGDTASKRLQSLARKYSPDKKRQERGMSYLKLYEGLIDSYGENLSFAPSEHAKLVFQNEYIFNDSRLEGVEVSVEEASEIVTDLRINKQSSPYCKEENEAYMSVAGHYYMYENILESPTKERCSVFDSISLNKDLFSCFPNPDYGGKIRNTDTLVLGAKFETASAMAIYPKLIEIDTEVKALFASKNEMSLSAYIEKVFELHHRLTVIHPFSDGNGRTLRAFMNIQLVRAGICPLYILYQEKEAYIHALEIADSTGRYDELHETLFHSLLRSNSEISY